MTGDDLFGFHRDALWMLGERNLARIYTMRIAGTPIASYYILNHGRYHAMYQSGYDPAFASLSPGLVLLARTIEDAFALEAREYDFLRGQEAYKYDWANDERQTVRLSLIRPNWAGMSLAAVDLAKAEGRRLAKAVLPQRLVEVIRKRRASTTRREASPRDREASAQ